MKQNGFHEERFISSGVCESEKEYSFHRGVCESEKELKSVCQSGTGKEPSASDESCRGPLAMKQLLLAVMVLLGPALRFAAADEQSEQSEKIDKAIEKALEYLANHQNEDGSWNVGHGGKSPAITGLSVMAFLSAGHVPGEGKY